MSLFGELRRRNVFRVGAAYVVVSWLIIQVAETIFPLFGFGDTPARLVVTVLAIGLIPTVVFAWAFELTPEGLKRESEVDRTDSITWKTARKLDRAIMAILALALAYFAVDKFLLEPVREQDKEQQIAQRTRSQVLAEIDSAQSATEMIAVLPLDSQSTAEEDVFLADGLTDEILSALAEERTIPVIGATSSFQIRGETKQDLPRLVEQLGVTHIVDGSVRRSQSGLRVSVHLVDAKSGQVLWSEIFVREEPEVYTIPAATASAILQAFGEQPLPSGSLRKTAPDPASYRSYLQARALMRSPVLDLAANLRRAISYLEEAVDRDPNMAEAWAALALNRLNIVVLEPGLRTTGSQNQDPQALLAAARLEAERALELNPSTVEALLALTIIDYRTRQMPLAEAEQRFHEVLEVSSENSDINVRMGMMSNELGRPREASEYFAAAVRIDPLNLVAQAQYLQSLMNTGRLPEARNIIESGRAPWYEGSYVRLEHLLLTGQFAEAHEWVDYARNFPGFASHGVSLTATEAPAVKERLDELMDRLVAHAEGDDSAASSNLPEQLIQAAADGFILHYYAALLLGAAGFVEPVFDFVLERLSTDDLYFRGALFRPAFSKIRADPSVMQWFDAGTQLYYWLETGRWPDFCSEPGLPYDCRETARLYIGDPAD